MEHYKVMLVSDTRSPQIGAVRLHDDSDDSLIELSFDDNTFIGTGDDFFDAFCHIREQLESLGLLPRATPRIFAHFRPACLAAWAVASNFID